MLTSSGYGAISPITPTKVYHNNKERESRISVVSGQNKYDSVTLSSAATRESRFRMDMIGRLSKEVRTATTTGDIHALRQEVRSGTYTPDPMAIAARILFLGEGQ